MIIPLTGEYTIFYIESDPHLYTGGVCYGDGVSSGIVVVIGAKGITSFLFLRYINVMTV